MLVGIAGTKVFQRAKERRELRLSEAHEAKIDAEAAQIIANTAVALVQPLQEQISKLDGRVKTLERENLATKSTLRLAIDYIRALRSWIFQHVPDKTPPVPPDALCIQH